MEDLFQAMKYTAHAAVLILKISEAVTSVFVVQG